MAVGHLAHNAVLPANLRFESPPPRAAVASYEGELTKVRLREALAREGALHRQIDELIRRQEIWSKLFTGREDAANRIANLTSREREIMDGVLAGDPSKNIAADLGISQRTVEKHRAAVMRKTGSKSLPALARLALAADVATGTAGSVVPLDAEWMNQRHGGKS